jgi:DNA-binding PadR family transcriptional regulator
MTISQNCPCKGGTLDKLIQPAILAVLSKGPSHGYQIAEEISKMPNSEGEKPDTSGIYRFLKNMESKGLVVSSWETPTTGHAKRCFEITPSGEACLSSWVETLEGYLATITSLLETTRKAAKPKKAKNKSRKPR